MAVYARLFGWLVAGLDRLLGGARDGGAGARVGILETFGLEQFEASLFEQLCINVANERLHALSTGMCLWPRRGRTTRLFNDYGAVLELLLGRPVGLLRLLDEESNYPKATDGSLAEKLAQQSQLW